MKTLAISGDQEFEALTRALAGEAKKHNGNKIATGNLLRRISRNRLIGDVARLRSESMASSPMSLTSKPK